MDAAAIGPLFDDDACSYIYEDDVQNIARKGDFETTVEVQDANSVIAYRFRTKKGSIGFSVYFGTSPKRLVEPFATYHSTGKAGAYHPGRPGVCTLRWSNGTGWTERELNYAIRVTRNSVEQLREWARSDDSVGAGTPAAAAANAATARGAISRPPLPPRMEGDCDDSVGAGTPAAAAANAATARGAISRPPLPPRMEGDCDDSVGAGTPAAAAANAATARGAISRPPLPPRMEGDCGWRAWWAFPLCCSWCCFFETYKCIPCLSVLFFILCLASFILTIIAANTALATEDSVLVCQMNFVGAQMVSGFWVHAFYLCVFRHWGGRNCCQACRAGEPCCSCQCCCDRMRMAGFRPAQERWTIRHVFISNAFNWLAILACAFNFTGYYPVYEPSGTPPPTPSSGFAPPTPSPTPIEANEYSCTAINDVTKFSDKFISYPLDPPLLWQLALICLVFALALNTLFIVAILVARTRDGKAAVKHWAWHGASLAQPLSQQPLSQQPQAVPSREPGAVAVPMAAEVEQVPEALPMLSHEI
eukprot:g2721.t1